MSPKEAYKELVERCKEISLLESCGAVLSWDEQVCMPKQASKLRSQQLSMLAGMIHEKFTDPKIGELISRAEESPLAKDPESIEAANIREFRYSYDKETKLPKSLVEEIAKTTSLAQGEWQEARSKKDFKQFQPWLEKIVDLVKQKAEAYGYEKEPYDPLLDAFEPGATTEEVAGIFEDLRGDLVDLVGRIKDAPRRPDESIIKRHFDVKLQRVFGEMVAAAMGFDFKAGRLDISTHPFTSGFGPGDTRMTTRYDPSRFNDALFGVMHETGHALYEMGIRKEEHFGTPAGESTSLGIHESQSRMWENQVGRSKEFWVYFLPQAKRIFREALAGVSLEDFYGAINYVTPSYIRVEADEATYNLHILLRFELERALVKGDLKVADVPGEWNSRFEKYFGLKVDNDSNGCLQDIHWSGGWLGYFPTYTLGNLYSAQFFTKAKEDIPDLLQQIEHGNLGSLLDWLRENIHRHGRRYRARVLGEKVTGQPLSHKPLIDYMNRKYSEIYGI